MLPSHPVWPAAGFTLTATVGVLALSADADPERRGTVKIGAGVTLTLSHCKFTNVKFDVELGAVVYVAERTSDGQPLESLIPTAAPGPRE